MIKELDVVVLTEDLPDARFIKGDVATVVHLYADEQLCEIEFSDLFGDTIEVVTAPVHKLVDARHFEGHTLHLNIAV